jgi:hypothetical protein
MWGRTYFFLFRLPDRFPDRFPDGFRNFSGNGIVQVGEVGSGGANSRNFLRVGGLRKVSGKDPTTPHLIAIHQCQQGLFAQGISRIKLRQDPFVMLDGQFVTPTYPS